jgi:hypothetical protein
VTEEVFPASISRSVRTSSRCSGRRSSANLDLPRHGLEILPLDGTFTPMPNGDHLWRVNDHAQTQREIRGIRSSTPRPTDESAQGDGRDGAVRRRSST